MLTGSCSCTCPCPVYVLSTPLQVSDIWGTLFARRRDSICLPALCHVLRGRSPGGRSTGGHSSTSATGVVVDERMVRWVPYKHANGMAIYYRQTPAEEGISQVRWDLPDAAAFLQAACQCSTFLAPTRAGAC
jgi:hypothetical protein